MNNEKTPKNEKQKLSIVFCIFGAIFLLLFVLVNRSTLSQWLSSVISVLNPVIVGFIIAYLINPVYNWFNNKALKKINRAKLKKTLSIIFTYVFIILVIALLLIIILPQVVVAVTDLVTKIDSYINAAVDLANNFIRNSELFNGEYANLFDLLDVNDITANLTMVIQNSGNLLKTVGNLLISYGSNIVVGVKDIFLGLFISIYIIIFKNQIAAWLKRILRVLMSRPRYDSFMHRVDHANGKFGNYIIGAITDSIIVAIECFIVFSIFRIPYAPLIAVIVGITNIIPILGPFLGGIPSAFIIFIVEPEKVILFIVLILIIQQIDGNLVAPMILGTSLGLSSLGIIIAITVMGGFWGIPGMFIGVPLFAFFADIIEESVNAKLSVIDDPDFPPYEQPLNENKHKSPIIAFVKKHIKKCRVGNKKAAGDENKNKK